MWTAQLLEIGQKQPTLTDIAESQSNIEVVDESLIANRQVNFHDWKLEWKTILFLIPNFKTTILEWKFGEWNEPVRDCTSGRNDRDPG